MAISAPPKLYLDTNHLVQIDRLRARQTCSFQKAYELIYECLRQRHFGIIFNPSAPLEWVDGKATQQSAEQLAGVIASARLTYQLEPDQFVYIGELLDECRRLEPGLRAPTLPPVHLLSPGCTFRPAAVVLANAIPGALGGSDFGRYLAQVRALPELPPIASVEEYVKVHIERALNMKTTNPSAYNERVEGYKAALTRDIDCYRSGGRPDPLDWMVRFLEFERLLAALDPRFDGEAIKRIVCGAQTDNCPAVSLWLRARWQRVKAGHPADDNEVDDWMFLPVVPYADLVLTDKEFREFILRADQSLQSKVFSDPPQAADALRKWT